MVFLLVSTLLFLVQCTTIYHWSGQRELEKISLGETIFTFQKCFVNVVVASGNGTELQSSIARSRPSPSLFHHPSHNGPKVYRLSLPFVFFQYGFVGLKNIQDKVELGHAKTI